MTDIKECDCPSKEMDYADCHEDQKVDGKCPAPKEETNTLEVIIHKI